MKTNKIVYYVSTGLLSAMMLMSVGMYFFKHEEISMTFGLLGHPPYLVYPLGIAKLLGLVAIWTRMSNTLKEWAYAGFFFNFVLAFFAHLALGDGEAGGAAVATALLLTSYIFMKRTYGESF